MNSIRASLTVLLFLSSIFASSKEVTDTLYSAKNDRVIVTYGIVQKGNRVDLEFKNVRKVLGDYHRGKYGKEVGNIHTLFFDRIGTEKDMKFTGETPDIIMLPSKASYTNSSDGYFIVEQWPTLSFDLDDDGAKSFTVPLYLAHYERKQHYKILCSCGNLEITLPSAPVQTSSVSSANRQPSKQRNAQVVEIGEEFDESQEQALNLIKSIYKELPEQDALPMSSTLEKKVSNLVDLQSKIKNEDMVRKIDEVLEAYHVKEKELQRAKKKADEKKADDDDFIGCNSVEAYELYLKQHPDGSHVEEAKAEIKSLKAREKEEEESKKKRNIWMIIGGVLLAILLFVGNQVLQSFRNIRTQRSMMQMQQDATKRAQNMARSKARSEIRKQTNKATNQIRKKGQTALRDTADKMKNNLGKVKNNNGNNRVSI